MAARNVRHQRSATMKMRLNGKSVRPSALRIDLSQPPAIGLEEFLAHRAVEHLEILRFPDVGVARMRRERIVVDRLRPRQIFTVAAQGPAPRSRATARATLPSATE